MAQYALQRAPVVLKGNAVLLAAIINGLRPQYCRWVNQGTCTTTKECFCQIQLVESQVSMEFKRQPNGHNPKSAPASNGAQLPSNALQKPNATSGPHKRP